MSWDGARPCPSARRPYALRSRIRYKVCQRRMCGATKPHPAQAAALARRSRTVRQPGGRCQRAARSRHSQAIVDARVVRSRTST